jgi:hypothetical protein
MARVLTEDERPFFSVFTNLDLLRYITKFYFKSAEDAVNNNRFDILSQKWEDFHKNSTAASIWRCAGKVGNKKIIEFLNEKIPLKENEVEMVLNCLAKNGRFETLEWFIDLIKNLILKTSLPPAVITEIVSKGPLTLSFKILEPNRSQTWSLLYLTLKCVSLAAISFDNVAVLEHCLLKYPVEIGKLLIESIHLLSSPNTSIWALKNLDWDYAESWAQFPAPFSKPLSALQNSKQEIKEWIIENLFITDRNFELVSAKTYFQLRAMNTAAQQGNLEILEFLFQKVGFLKKKILDTAVSHGHLELVKWIQEKSGLDCSLSAFNHAVT